MFPIASIDIIALVWFLLCWVVYALVAARQRQIQPSLHEATYTYREEWMLRVLERDNRIADAALMGNLMGTVSFLASTSVIVIGSLVAALGATEHAVALIAELPFAEPTSPESWALKVMLLLVIFVYAFFKFTWSLRQFNLCCILIGAAPLKVTDQEEGHAYARRAACLHYQAGSHYNRGLRAYYSGLAVLTWFIDPWLFMAVSTGLMVILNRREFASNILKTLERSEEAVRVCEEH